MLERKPDDAAIVAPEILSPVAVVPDQIGMECPACAETHLLWRGLDFDESPDGVWRCVEAGQFIETYACDCGVKLSIAFTLTVQPIPALPPDPEPR
jgi:predicted RNA-binding Zn-ribbon protein involved in translation (DUF1610 family)